MLSIDENGFTTVIVDGEPQLRRAQYVQGAGRGPMGGRGHFLPEVEPELQENEELVRTISGDAYITTTR